MSLVTFLEEKSVTSLAKLTVVVQHMLSSKGVVAAGKKVTKKRPKREAAEGKVIRSIFRVK
jgi:predicted house-cleaning noncanonical NTP pyrophosphatase (MazG superfamily)